MGFVQTIKTRMKCGLQACQEGLAHKVIHRFCG